MKLARADGSHTMHFGDESDNGSTAAAVTAKLAIHAVRDREKNAKHFTDWRVPQALPCQVDRGAPLVQFRPWERRVQLRRCRCAIE
jgi:hypothetical protein